MPLLPNARHERFAQELASGKSATQAYICAGYSKKGAGQSGDRLLKNADICSRVEEIKAEIAGGIIKLQIRDANCRVAELQDRWDRLRQVIRERAADPTMRKIPGGTTGLLVRQLKQVGSGRDAQLVEEYAVDTGMLRETRAHEEQAAKELGQWDEKKIAEAVKPTAVTYRWGPRLQPQSNESSATNPGGVSGDSTIAESDTKAIPVQ